VDDRARGPRDQATPSEPDHPTDLLALYALDVLDDAEQRPLESHLRHCAACRSELADLRATLDALPLAAAPAAPPARARTRLLERVAAARHQRQETVSERHERRLWIGWPVWTPAAGLAAGATGLAAAAFSWSHQASLGMEVAALHRAAATAQAQVSEQAGVLIGSDPSSTRLAAIQGSGQAAPRGRLVYQPGAQTALAVLEGLPPLEPGQVYQLWLLQGNIATSAGTFMADARGAGSHVIRAPSQLGSYTAVGLTAEPAPGLPSPSGLILASGVLG
jgi:anti-sigma-K factor RskA